MLICCSKKIKSEISDNKFIFILRDPIDRLQSWFKFAKLNGLIEKTLLFEDYVKLQMKHPDPKRPQHMRSLEQGNYSLYLKQYIEIFGPENIHITFYEDLAKDPLSFCKSICHFLKISSDYFTTYQFKIYNESVGKRHVVAHQLFRKLKRTIRPATRLFHDSLRKRLKLAGYTIEKMYTSANKDNNENTFHINPDLMNQLRQYYAADISQMNQLLRKNLPWKTGSNQ
ncbi:MAG: sulfotransferase domain-containing protein [Bacteroidetes bacterium]|nr:sulfotransferase domain-containing protein [Bacteroidota bacterium]